MPFADPWVSTEAPIADFGFMALITRWRTRSHTSTVCEKLPRKNCGGSSLARKGQSRISHGVRRGSLQRCEELGTEVLNSAFWNTSGKYERLGATMSRAVLPART